MGLIFKIVKRMDAYINHKKGYRKPNEKKYEFGDIVAIGFVYLAEKLSSIFEVRE